MKSGATESSFYYLNQYYSFPNNVEVSRSIEVLAQSNKQYKILWAHDNCDQPQLLRLPELVSQIDLIVCVSNWEAEQYIKYNRAPAEKIVVIPNGVADIFHLKSPKSKTAIYFSGPHKGITPLPKIWKQVIKNHPDAKLKVFSSHNLYGEQYEQHFKIPEHLEAIEELKSLPGVEYSPCIDREQLLPHIQDASFFVHPNVWEETFCVSMAEAMVCGCYPITSDIGALREVSFNRGKYIPMTGKNTTVGWEPSPKFINEFAQELSRCFEFFDKEPQTFYAATKELSQITKETYDWKKIAVVWSKLIYQVSEEKGFDESYTNNQYEIDKFSQDDVVIDIGAHRGFFSKLCLDKGCKEIHCFEPEPKNYECLIDNLKSYQNFRGYNLAVSNKNGEKDFFIFSGINTGLHSFYPNKEKGFLNSFDIGTKIKVKTVSLDDILNNFSKVALIKVDAEGSEFDILMNSKLLFKVDKIIGEYHNDLTDKKSEDLFKYLEQNNFVIVKDNNQKCVFTAEKNNAITKQTDHEVSSNNDKLNLETKITNNSEEYLSWFSSVNCLPPKHIGYLYKLKYKDDIEPKVVYDIGANCLHWYNQAKECWDNAEYYLMDGTKHFEFLYKRSGNKYSTDVLSDVDGKNVTYYENIQMSGGNSYYELNYKDFPENTIPFKNQHYTETKRITRSLDSIVRENNWKKPDLIKMDVQGAELDILKGAKETLKTCDHLILELQTKEFMKGAPMLQEVVEYLKTIGYELESNICISPVQGVDGDYHFCKKKVDQDIIV